MKTNGKLHFACIFLILVFSFLSLIVVGQSNENNKFKLGISTSFDYCFRKISYAGENSIQESFYNDAKENETWRLGFSTGLNASYRISKLISIESGVLYFRRGYRYQDELTTESPDPRYGFITNSAQKFSIVIMYAFNYVDIPLKFCLNLGMGKHDFIIGAGFVNSFLVRSWKNGMLRGSENGKTSQSRVQ